MVQGWPNVYIETKYGCHCGVCIVIDRPTLSSALPQALHLDYHNKCRGNKFELRLHLHPKRYNNKFFGEFVAL